MIFAGTSGGGSIIDVGTRVLFFTGTSGPVGTRVRVFLVLVGTSTRGMVVRRRPTMTNIHHAALAMLAQSLFADTSRNRIVMPRWMRCVTGETPGAADIYAESRIRERDRQDQRTTMRVTVARKQGGPLENVLGAQRESIVKTLVPTAVTSVSRRMARSASTLKRVIESMSTAAAPPPPRSSSLMLTLRAYLHTLLMSPIRIVICTTSNTSLRVHLFGQHALQHFYVPSAVLSRDECVTIEYLATCAGEWTAVGSTQTTLIADDTSNDVVELSLNRTALLWSACETILYGTSMHERGRHLLDAALHSLASMPDIIASGYFTTLIEMAQHVRAAPLSITIDLASATISAADFSRRYNIRTTDSCRSLPFLWSSSQHGHLS